MAAESKTAWTPGPWKAVQNGLGFIGVRTADEDWITYSAGPDRFGRATQEANARLVSKAPELVEALQQAFDALCSLATIANGEMPSWSEAFEHDALKVDAAQNKARALLQQIRGD